MVSYIEYGNIFDLPNVTNYAHGCNCAGAMGKGIALQFKQKYPQMYLEYKAQCKTGKFSLGDIFIYGYGNGIIFNLGTQETWKTKASIEAIKSSFNKMLAYAQHNNIKSIALPKIGAGLGGQDWATIKNIINKAAEKYPNIDLLVVENYSA